MTPSILGLTFNDLTSLYRTKPEINTSKSETDPFFSILCKKVCTQHLKCDILRAQQVTLRSLSIPSRVELGIPGQLVETNKQQTHRI